MHTKQQTPDEEEEGVPRGIIPAEASFQSGPGTNYRIPPACSLPNPRGRRNTAEAEATAYQALAGHGPSYPLTTIALHPLRIILIARHISLELFSTLNTP